MCNRNNEIYPLSIYLPDSERPLRSLYTRSHPPDRVQYLLQRPDALGHVDIPTSSFGQCIRNNLLDVHIILLNILSVSGCQL